MHDIDAVAFSWAGDKYLGRPYSEMDCQAFVEQCMADSGLRMDLPGSNAWYRQMTWTGSPEECKKRFGEIPKGALLFILLQDGREPDKYKPDGIGNASHIGIRTGRGEGAIHSSSSRGCVAASKFQDKTIPNGGWNRVGLWDRFDYGAKINALLDGGADPEPADPDEPGEDETMQRATVWAANGKPVKMRASRKEGTAGYKLYEELPVGTVVEVISRGDEWSQISYGTRSGWWMKSVFLVFGDVVVEPGGQDDFGPDDLAADPDDEVTLSMTLSRKDAETLLTLVDRISWELVQMIGRG